MESETALEWFCRLKSKLCLTTAGCDGLDDVLGGSIPLMAVTEIAGDAGTGKCLLAMSIIARVLLSEERSHFTPVVLNHTPSINTRNLRKVALAQIEHADNVTAEDAEALLRRVELYNNIYTPDELEKCLLSLRPRFFSNDAQIPLVIVNSIGAILSDTSYGEQAGVKVQDRILKALREFCLATGGAIITLNDVVQWRGVPTAALGMHWIDQIPNRILLCKDERSDNKYAQLQHANATNFRYSIREGRFEWDEIFSQVAVE